MSFPRYPEYKDSGVAWLGTVPLHWDLVPLKQVISRIESGTSVNAIDTPAGDGELGVLKTSCVYHGHFDADENKAVIPDEYDRVACPVTAGTLVVSRMNTPDLVGAAGVVHVSHENLFLPDRLWQVHFDGADPNFVHHWTHTPAYRAQVEMACAGTSSSMQNLGQDQFRCFVIPRPSFSEQTAIATFLDRETAKIDALVAEQEKLIALLQEKRQAVISHAVTKGLDPNVPMKDSGVEWLGEVPIHWEVSPFKWLLDRNDGGVWGDDPDGTDDTLVLRSTEQTVDGQWRLENAATRKLSATERAAALLESGDLVVTKSSGSSLHIGKTTLVTDEIAQLGCCYSNFMQRLRMKPSFSPLLAWYILNNDIARLQFDLLSNSTTGLANLNGTMIGQMMLAIPPGEEQTAIATFLDRETAKLDTLMTEARSAITLLQERRTALISAAVTGQIDVRGLAGGANAPDSIAASAYPASAGA